MERVRGRSLLVIPFLLTFIFLTAGPLVILVVTSFYRRTPLGGMEAALITDAYRTLFDPLYLKVLGATLGFAFLNTCLCLFFAYPMAFYLSRIPARQRNFWLTLILIPFWTSFLIRILAFMDVLRLQIFGVDLLYTTPGILMCLVYNYLPFAVLPLFSTLEKIPNSLFEAARDLGASRLQVFTRVLWPLSRSGVLTASLLVFIPSMGEYLIPEIVGGGRTFLLGTFLQNQFLSARNWPLGAAAIACVLVLTAVLLLVAAFVNRLSSLQKRRSQASDSKLRPLKFDRPATVVQEPL